MRKLMILLAAAAICFSAKAQDTRKIVLSPYVAENSGVPKASMSVLENKLKSLITNAGFGSDYPDRMVLTARVTPVSEDVTPTAPPIYVYTLNFDLYIGDAMTGTMFSTTQIEGKGSGKTKDQAYLAALKSIKPGSPALQAFIKEGQQKVIDYYQTNGPGIIRKAQSLVEQQKYDEAAFQLMSIPEACPALYEQANRELELLFYKQIDEEGQRHLAAARKEWAAGQDMDAANRAGEHLAQINPASPCYKQAEAFQQEIAQRVKQLSDREWNFKMMQYKNDAAYRSQLLAAETKLERERIRAVRDVYVSRNNRPAVVYNTRWW